MLHETAALTQPPPTPTPSFPTLSTQTDNTDCYDNDDDDDDANNERTGNDDRQMEISTLTVTPPSSGNATDTLEVITDYFDASDIDVVVAGETVTWAGGARGVALFLALLVLLSGTCCCCVCVALGMLW